MCPCNPETGYVCHYHQEHPRQGSGDVKLIWN